MKCEESGFSPRPASEALATHIWQLFCINTVPQWYHSGRHKRGQNGAGVDGCIGRESLGHKQSCP